MRRRFNPPAPNRTGVADFTYCPTWSGMVYVAFVIDAYAWRILGTEPRSAGPAASGVMFRLGGLAKVGDPVALDAAFDAAVAEGTEGLVCKAVARTGYRAGARGWQWIKLKRDYRTELADTIDLVVVGAYRGAGRRRGTYGAVLLAAYDPDTETYRTVGRCGTGFSDTQLLELPGLLAPYLRTEKPARVDARVPADVWFEPAMVLEVLSAELTVSPNHTAGWNELMPEHGAGDALPAVHRAAARGQGAAGRDDDRRAGRAVPHRPPDEGLSAAPAPPPVPGTGTGAGAS